MTMEEGRTFCAKIHGHLLAIETKTEALYVQVYKPFFLNYRVLSLWSAALKQALNAM